jgi:hypothetical protein
MLPLLSWDRREQIVDSLSRWRLGLPTVPAMKHPSMIAAPSAEVTSGPEEPDAPDHGLAAFEGTKQRRAFAGRKGGAPCNRHRKARIGHGGRDPESIHLP